MTDEKYDYYQLQMQQNKATHRTPISPKRIPSEAENHKKDGQCKIIVPPNLPSIGGRVKYAMGALNVGEFSQQTGISISYLTRICNGKEKTISEFNAKRISAASPMGVSADWLLGLKQAGIKEDALPNIETFAERLEFAKNRCGKTAKQINNEIGASHGYYSAVIRERLNVGDKFKAPLAKALDVEYDWLFKGCPNDKELAKRKGINAVRAVKDKDFVGSKAINRGSEHKKMEVKEEKISSGTHLRFEGVYSGDVLSALVSVLKGTYRVNLTIDEVEKEL